ncbi:hypothetical protein FS749_003197 [Ceratobasidium sp. UAMH 11750]|nr:hypothetical protein FS749_003197 [Ceratobasidium sp. UAMH 11750]
MTTSPSPSRPRHPFETVGTGRVVALGDPADDSLTLSLTGINATAPTTPAEKDKDKDFKEIGVLGLTRKVSARFGRRKRAGTSAGAMQNDAEAEDWSREKERAGMRAVGMSPVLPRHLVSDRGRSRISRHLSIENLSDLVHEGGARFELETARGSAEKERVVGSSRTRKDSMSRRDDSKTRRDAARSVSSPGQGYAESRSTGIVSLENKTGGGKLWRLVKKMSTGTLKEKRSSYPEKPPPVPPLPPTLSSSRRSSVADYGEQIQPELAQHRSGSQSTRSSRPNTIHQSSTDLTQPQSHRSPIASRLNLGEHTSSRTEHSTPGRTEYSTPGRTEHTTPGRLSLAEYRPSMTHTTESSVLSSSPKSSFGRTHSPRTSMSSYVDVAEDMPPPLPMVVGKPPVPTGKQSVLMVGKQSMSVVVVGKQPVSGSTVGKQPVSAPPVGKHIVAPGELAQYQHLFPPARDPNTSPIMSSPSLPPPKRPRKPREKIPLPASTVTTDSGTIKAKSKPNLLRRPTRLDDDGSSLRTRSPRSASMGLPSPRSASVNPHSPRVRSRTQSEAQTPSPRPRSSSMGTVFTFRELGERKPLSEQEKVDKFERLLEASDKAGGTLHARLQERLLLSDTMRLSYDGSSVSGL